MLIEEVKKLSPVERLQYWITERYSIFTKRQAGKKPPWTDDTILQTYRFCNVIRIDDRVSQWLLHNWYAPNKDHPNMLLACALARFINNPHSLEHVEFPLEWNPELIKRRLREVRDMGSTVFNAAYMVRGNDGVDKIESVVDHNVQPLLDNDIQVDRTSMRNTWRNILASYGMGSFMAGQIVADLRWALTGSWADKLTWAPAGPGSMRGLNRVMGRDYRKPMDQFQFLEEITEHVVNVIKPRLNKFLVARMELHDWQNCLCEHDKHERMLWGQGKPKQRYRGEGNKKTDRT